MRLASHLASRAARCLLTGALAACVLVGAVEPVAAQPVDPHYSAGVAAFTAGDYAKSITEMNASLAAQPTAKAALYLGNAHLKLGHLGAAKSALQRALELDPNNPKRETILTLIKRIDSAQAARVMVTSTPPGATIYLETQAPSAARGKTPSELVLSPGRHEIIVVLDGYEPVKQVRSFKAGEKGTIEVDLQTRGCALALSAEPPAAQASVDDAAPEALPTQTRVGVGAHKVTFTAEGFTTQVLPVDCDGTTPLTLTAKLAATVVSGRVKFPPLPGLAVAADGRALSAEEIAEGVTLPVGRHEIVFTGAGRKSSTQVIFVAASEEVAIALPPPAPPEPAPPPPPRDERSPPPRKPARSAYPRRGIYAGLLGGGNLSLVEWNLGTDTNGAYPKSSAAGGLRAGVQILPRLAVEGDVLWVGLPNRLDGGLGHGSSTSASALFHVLAGRWTPVVEAGAGTYQVISSSLRSDIDLRLHAGVGLRGAIGDVLVIRADVRDVLTDGFDRSIGNNVEALFGVETYLWKAK